jgi:FAD/FMN-containing dehydrogenase/Fe-S oxidoreductase
MKLLSRPASAPAAGSELANDLREVVRGEVRFDDGSRALYATDGSNYRQTPIGVVVPRDVDDVVRAVEVCRTHDVPILGRGGGTSLAGQTCNEAVVFDFSKYLHRILEIDPERRIARVEPGVVLDSLRDAAEEHGLTFAPDPSTHRQCTLGGMIGNNSCGVHSVMAGKVEENMESLSILTYRGDQMEVAPTSEDELEAIIRGGGARGRIYDQMRLLVDRYADEIRARYPDIPRRVSGYNLNRLLPEAGFDVAKALVGTESTCAITLEATLRLVPSPPSRTLLVIGYEDVFLAADDVPAVLEHEPIGLEGIDDLLVEDMKTKGLHPKDLKLLPDGKGWLVVEFGGRDREEADAQAKEAMAAIRKKGSSTGMKLFDRQDEEDLVWEIRESGLGATARVPNQPDTWEGWEDSAVPPEKLGDYLRDLRALYRRFRYHGALYGHFGQGCIHTRINFDLVTAEGIATFRSFLEEATDLIVSYGGSFSGEHGDGQSRAEFLPKMFGDELVKAFGEFKGIWDPDGRMNPGKVVDPYRVTENLRLGTSYRPPHLETTFRFPDDEGTFSRGVERCVGVGNCRRLEGGVMCPSYMVTREEQHSTRGRARLLFEMMRGDPLEGGWRNDDVREALDLCLACKGCKGECPVNVDMATYKAEFLSHHYRGRLRPAAAYSIGLIDKWARVGSAMPFAVNALTQNRVLAALLKRAGGVASEREIPRFAPTSFRAWFRRRGPRPGRLGRVILWADTFNNAFHPAVAAAGVRVLEHAGFEVTIPQQALCCGRPLYDFGMLKLATSYLRKILESMRDDIGAGVPVVGLEPSCVAVFRDELVNLFPDDLDAKRLSEQTFTLSEFLQREGVRLPRVTGKVLVQEHCHHKNVMGTKAESDLMADLGLEVEILDSGCCGMAGSFGFERGDKYDVSVAAGERALLPAVRAADPRTVIVADGFSCREQVFQGTGRKPLHLAQVIAKVLDERGPVHDEEAQR